MQNFEQIIGPNYPEGNTVSINTEQMRTQEIREDFKEMALHLEQLVNGGAWKLFAKGEMLAIIGDPEKARRLNRIMQTTLFDLLQSLSTSSSDELKKDFDVLVQFQALLEIHKFQLPEENNNAA